MGLVHAGVGGDEGNSFGLFLDALHGGLIAIYEDDGDVAFHHPRFHRVAADFYLFLSPNRSHKKPNNPPIIEKATAIAIAVKIPNDHTE